MRDWKKSKDRDCNLPREHPWFEQNFVCMFRDGHFRGIGLSLRNFLQHEGCQFIQGYRLFVGMN